MVPEILERLEAIERKIGNPAREYLGVREAAEYLGLSKQQLDVHRMKRTGPAFHKVGRRVLYAIRDLRTWMDTYRKETLS